MATHRSRADTYAPDATTRPLMAPDASAAVAGPTVAMPAVARPSDAPATEETAGLAARYDWLSPVGKAGIVTMCFALGGLLGAVLGLGALSRLGPLGAPPTRPASIAPAVVATSSVETLSGDGGTSEIVPPPSDAPAGHAESDESHAGDGDGGNGDEQVEPERDRARTPPDPKPEPGPAPEPGVTEPVVPVTPDESAPVPPAGD